MVNIYVRGKQLDTFADESINIVTTTKNVRDVSKIYDDFTQQFSVPASGNNNSILHRFIDNAITLGTNDVDYRVKQPAVIEINGVLYKRGYIQYESASYTLGKLSHHVITFVGSLLSLSEIFEEATLADLDYANLNHIPTLEIVQDGIDASTTIFNGDIIYPLISNSTTFYAIEDGTIPYTAFKPSIRVPAILEAITRTFNISIGFQDIDISKLFMWCQREPVPSEGANIMTYDTGLFNEPPTYGTFYTTSGNFVVYDIETYNGMGVSIDIAGLSASTNWTIRMQISATNTTSNDAWQEIPNASVSGTGTTLGASLSYTFPPLNSPTRDWSYFRLIVITDVPELTATYLVTPYAQRLGDPIRYLPTVQKQNATIVTAEASLGNRIPNLKVIDFITDLAKLINAVPTVAENYIDFTFRPYDNWLGSTGKWDITNNVDITSYTVTMPSVPSEISLRFQEPTTYMAVYSSNSTDANYGDYISTPIGGTGEPMEVQVGFESLLWSKIQVPVIPGPPANREYLICWAFESVTTDIVNGEILNPNETSAFLFLYDDTLSTNSSILLEGATAPITSYKVCNNVMTTYSGNQLRGVNFADVPNAWTSTIGLPIIDAEYSGLYINYWQNYINNATNESARIYRYNAVIPISKLSQINTSTYLKIGDRTHIINSLSTDTLSGITKLELLNYTRYLGVPDAEPDTAVPTIGILSLLPNAIPTTPTNLIATNILDTSFTLSWDASTSASTGIVQYNIYNDGILYNSITGFPPFPTTSINGLPIADASQWSVVAMDAEGLVSLISDPLVVQLLGAVNPVFTDPIRLVSTATNNIEVEWSPATKGAGTVAYYDMYLNDNYITTISATDPLTYIYQGLTIDTQYAIRIVVFDDLGYSDTSNTVFFSTSLDITPPSTVNNLIVSNVGTTTATLSWNIAFDNVGVTRYNIYNSNDQLLYFTPNTQYNLTGLTLGLTYRYYVRAQDAAGNIGPASNIVVVNTSDTQIPTNVVNLTVSNITPTSARLAWSPASDNIGVVGYNIYNNAGTLLYQTVNEFYSLSGLINNTQYQYKVKARDGSGNLSANFSNTVTFTARDFVVPSDVTGLTAQFVTEVSVQLNWYPATDNVGISGYNIYNSLGQLQYTVGNVTQFIPTNLIADTTYTFKIKAFDPAGNVSTNFSNTVTITTLDGIVPTDVQNFRYTNLVPNSVTLQWNASTDNTGIAGYRIYDATAVEGTFPLYTTGNVLSYNLTGLTALQTYSYKAKAVDTDGNVSANFSNIVTFTALEETAPVIGTLSIVPNAPDANSPILGTLSIVQNINPDNPVIGRLQVNDGLNARPTFPVLPFPDNVLNPAGATDNTLTVTWLDAIPSTVTNSPIVQYNFYVGGYYYGRYLIQSTLTNVFTAKGLIPGKTYDVQVEAVDALGENVFANTIQMTTTGSVNPPVFNSVLTVSNETTSSVQLNWTGVTQNDYTIADIKIYLTGVLVATLPPTATTYIQNNLSSGTSYQFKARVTDIEGYYTETASVVASTLDILPIFNPTITVGTVTDAEIPISWTSASPGTYPISYYEVYLDGAPVTTVGTNLSYTYTGLTQLTQYNITVRVYDTQGNFTDSTTIQVTTIASVLPGFLMSNSPTTVCSTTSVSPKYATGTGVGSSTDGSFIPADGSVIYTSDDATTVLAGGNQIWVVKSFSSTNRATIVVDNNGLVSGYTPCTALLSGRIVISSISSTRCDYYYMFKTLYFDLTQLPVGKQIPDVGMSLYIEPELVEEFNGWNTKWFISNILGTISGIVTIDNNGKIINITPC